MCSIDARRGRDQVGTSRGVARVHTLDKVGVGVDELTAPQRGCAHVDAESLERGALFVSLCTSESAYHAAIENENAHCVE